MAAFGTNKGMRIEEALKHDPGNLDIRRIAKEVAFFRSEYERLSGKAKK